MATATETIDTPQFVKKLRWWDGFYLALTIPAGGFALIGYSIGVLGGWTAAALWGAASAVAVIQNYIFAEMAAMFPEKPGGIALYAHEGWRRYFSPVGPLAAVGYWAGWSLTLAVFGLLIGSLVQSEWFPGVTGTVSTGISHVGLPHVIGAVAIILVWLLNVFGVKPAVWTNYIIGGLMMLVITIFIVGPFVTGHWHAGNMTWGLGEAGQPWGGWKIAIVYLYLLSWTAYGTEICATFAPEYKRPRDTKRALQTSGLYTLIVLALLPIAATGEVGKAAITANPIGFYGHAFDIMIGPAGGIVVAILCLSLFLSMNSATADAGRALYGIARDGMTIRQLDHLNARNVPGRAMTLDLVVNLLVLFFVGNTLGILFASNLGYMVAIVFALSGFILLRRDRPGWPRPIRLGTVWVAVAAVLVVYNAVLLVVGGLNPGLAGYGGLKEQLIGVGILCSSFVLFAIRRLVQDRAPIVWREPTPKLPDEHPAVVTGEATSQLTVEA
jgi:amino acid transporter